MAQLPQKYQFKFEDNQLDQAMQLAFSGIFDMNAAISAMMNKAQLVATVDPSTGLLNNVDVISGGAYSSVPTVAAIGGGGTGATFTAVLDTNTGAIRSVTVNSHGSGYTSPPTLVVSGGQ